MLMPNCNTELEYILAHWINERMNILWARLNGEQPPYTKDQILQRFKFTNVYRVTDRQSQFLLRHVQYNQDWSPEDLMFRTILFKHFNLSSTWMGLLEALGKEPSLSNFEVGEYSVAMDYVALSYPVIYNNAYMTAGVRGFEKKHYGYMANFAQLFDPRSGFIESALKAKSLQELHTVVGLQSYIGEFLAYQYTIDLNYTPIWKFDENDLYVATVGSKRGIEKLLDGKKPRSYPDVIRFYTQYQNELMQVHEFPDFVNLFGRPLKAIDIQNCFCELDKYCRVFKPDTKPAGANQPKRIKNTFKRNSLPYRLMFPTWWDIAQFNDKYEVS